MYIRNQILEMNGFKANVLGDETASRRCAQLIRDSEEGFKYASQSKEHPVEPLCVCMFFCCKGGLPRVLLKKSFPGFELKKVILNSISKSEFEPETKSGLNSRKVILH